MKKLLITILTFYISFGALHSQIEPPVVPLQGGENIASAVWLTGSLPISVSGTTSGFADDYDESCPYPATDAPDVVYAYSPAANIIVDIDLCGSSFDTKLYLYENTATPGIPYDCNDDFYFDETCGLYVSRIESVELTGGNTYYIVIDGYDEFAFGNYILTISDNTPPPVCTWGVDISCPAGAVNESEACGAETNDGCSMPAGSENWETVPPVGAVFCGTLWAAGGNRDYDEYELVLAEPSLVVIMADADRAVQFGLMTGGNGGYGGNPDCQAITGLSPIAGAGPCNAGFLDLGLLNPGKYWFSIALVADNGLPCNNHYWLDFDVIPQPCPSPVDLTAASITATTAELAWTETGSATEWEYQLGLSGFTPANAGTVTVQNPKAVEGLLVNTQYDFYVRASCDPSFSEWEGPFTFTTLCSSTVSIPWSESFENSWPPSCWTDGSNEAYAWDQSIFGTPHSGSEWAFCNLEGAVLTSPDINLALSSCLLFWYRVENASFPQSFTVKAGNDTLLEINGASNETYQKIGISLAGYTGQTISVSFILDDGTGAQFPGICLDDVSVQNFNVWTGNVSNSWNNSRNWSQGHVPLQTDPVLIPSDPAGNVFPHISGNIGAECGFLAISPGAIVTVATGNSLNVKSP